MEEMQAKQSEDNRKLKERMDALEAEMVGMKSEIRDAERDGKEGRALIVKKPGEKQLNEGSRVEGASEGWQMVNRKKENFRRRLWRQWRERKERAI